MYPITFVPSLQKEAKHINNFCFHSWKETPNKDISIVCTYSIYMMNIMKMISP